MNTETQYQKLPQEMKLLALCARNTMSEQEQKSAQEIIGNGINWNTFCTMANKHKIYPVVFPNLRKLNNEKVDREILQKLEGKCKSNQMKALGFTSELIKVMRLLTEQNIRAISIKGPCLAMSIYQDISKRVSRDLDILVNSRDLAQIDQILRDAGYASEDAFFQLSPKQFRAHLKKAHHVSYSNQMGVHLEIHWRLSNSNYGISFENAWDSGKEMELYGQSIHVLSPEENLLYLILHGSKHAWKRLRWLCDVYEIVSSHVLDWEYIQKQAKKTGVFYQIKQTEYLLKILLQYDMPVQLKVGRADERMGKRLAEMAIPVITAMDDSPELQGHGLYGHVLIYAYIWRKSFGKRIYFLSSLLVPGTAEFDSWKIKDRYFFLYYFLRPFRILNTCVRLRIRERGRK